MSTTTKPTDADDEGPRSFSRFIATIADGEAEGTLSEELQKLANRCRDEALRTGDKAKGSLTLSLKLVVEPKGFVGIGYSVETKAPKRRTSAAMAWLTKGGNLTHQDPRQQVLPLRDVTAPRAAEAREVESPGAAAAREAGARLAAARRAFTPEVASPAPVSMATPHDDEDAARIAAHAAASEGAGE